MVELTDGEGIYSGPGLNISWVAGNVAKHYKRSAAFGLNQLMGNSAGAAYVRARSLR